MNDLGSLMSDLGDLLIGADVKGTRCGNDVGVGRFHAIYIGIYLNGFGAQSGTERGGGGVAASTTEGGDGPMFVAIFRLGGSLEAADHGNVTLFEQAQDVLGAYFADTGIAELRVGDDAGLPTGECDGFIAERLEGVGEHHCGDDLTAGHNHIEFARGRRHLRVNAFEKLHKSIGGVRSAGTPYRRDDDNGMISGLSRFDDLANGHLSVLFGIYGGASEFLDEDFHDGSS